MADDPQYLSERFKEEMAARRKRRDEESARFDAEMQRMTEFSITTSALIRDLEQKAKGPLGG